MRVAFFGSPPFATPILQRLIACDHEVVCVVTQPDRRQGRKREATPSEIALLAREHGLPLLQPESTKDPAFLAALMEHAPEVSLIASYGELLRQDVLDAPSVASLNVHGSLLPRWRGASPIQAALLAGDPETGVSVQRMVLALDAGDVLLEKRTPIAPGDTAGALFERLAQLGAEAAVEALDRLQDGSAQFTPQDEALVTHCKKLKKADGELDWGQGALQLERQVRAMNPWPGAFSTDPKGRRVTLLEAEVQPAGHMDAAPGTILAVEEQLLIATGQGALAPQVLQAAGKRALDAAEFQRGARFAVGDVWGLEA